MDQLKDHNAQQLSGKARVVILTAILAAIGLLVYRAPLAGVMMSVLHRENASHGICVPVISAYLLWLKRNKIRNTAPGFAPVHGMAGVGAGLLLYLAAGTGEETLSSLSFLLVAGGLTVGLFGKHLFKELAFPLFFLAAMIPLPQPLYAQLTQWMRIATTWGAVEFVKLFNFPLYRDGYHIVIPTVNLFIDHGCSGIRYLIPYLVFGLAYAFVTRRALRSRLAVVVAAIPIAILAGVLRQSSIFLLAYYISPFFAEHRPHVLISWTVFISVLLGAMWIDRTVAAKRNPATKTQSHED